MNSILEQSFAAPAAQQGSLGAVEPSRLALRGITKTWPGQTTPVLDGVDLEIPPGQLVSIVGRNGAGKTTLLRIAAGLIFADSGTVNVDGFEPRKHRRKFQRRIGFLSASYGGLYARLSVRQHLDLWARIAFIPPGERRAATESVIERFELRPLMAARRVDRLSMGQRQRLRLAMAFVHEPRVVLLDEPWNSLDEEGHEIVTSALTSFVTGGGSAICCSPTGAEIGSNAHLTYGVSDGKVISR